MASSDGVSAAERQQVDVANTQGILYAHLSASKDLSNFLKSLKFNT